MPELTFNELKEILINKYHWTEDECITYIRDHIEYIPTYSTNPIFTYNGEI